MPTWLTDLPSPKVEYGEDLQSPVIATKMEAGSTRQRLRFTTTRKIANVSWILTNLEYALFEAFVKYELSQGADAFTISLPQSGYSALIPVTAVIRGGVYTADAIAANTRWRVGATLIIDQPNHITEGLYEIILEVGATNLETFSDLSNQLYIATNNLNMN